MTGADSRATVRREVEVVASLDAPGFHRLFEERDSPLVVRGGARALPAVGRWTLEYLTQKVGSVRVPHKLSATNKHPDFDQPSLASAFARGESTLDELFRAVTTGPEAERAKRLFTGEEKFLLRRRDGVTTLDSDLAPLWDDVGRPSLVPEERLYSVWSWFSGRGVRTWLHYDNNGCHNLNAQITGEKDCLLFEPNAIEGLYFFDPDGPNPAHNCSAVDVDAPDALRFPAFAHVPAWRASLEAGDLLFIPAWWPHAFLHRGGFNANVNFWWKPEVMLDNAIARRQAALDAATASSASYQVA
ncbi:MAG TPA: cupin-like domain-containing protein [Polyangiaceae bacterium]